MTDLVTVAPDQLPQASIVSPRTLTVVQEPGGPVQSIAIRQLLGRLISTDEATATEADLQVLLGYASPAIALVFADPDPAKCGWYCKVGAAGAGNWTLFETLSETARVAATASAVQAIASAAEAEASATASAAAATTATQDALVLVDARVEAVEASLAAAQVDLAALKFAIKVDPADGRLLLFVDGSDDEIELGQFGADGSFSANKYGGVLGAIVFRYGDTVTDGSGDLFQMVDASDDELFLLRQLADGNWLGKGLGGAGDGDLAQVRADTATALEQSNTALAATAGSSRRRLMRELAVSTRLANPVILPAMTTPPTITCAPGGAPADLPVTIGASRAGAFAVLGGDVLGAGTDFQLVCSVTIPGPGNVGPGKSSLAWAVEFWSDAPKLALWLNCDPTNCWFRVQVSGQYVTKLFTRANAAGGPTSVTLDFAGVRQARLIRFEGGGNTAFRGVYATKYDAVWAPVPDDMIRAAFVGDSLVEGLAGQHSPDPGAGWAPVTADLLGWRNARIAAIGGTGYVNPGPADGVHWKFGDHAADWLNWQPDTLVFLGTVNDTGNDPGAVATEARRVWSQARAALPDVPIFIGGLAVDPNFVGGAAAIENAMADAFAAWGDPNSLFVRMATDPDGSWIVGGGADGVDYPQTGVGDSDVYEGGPPHPNQQGDEYLAYRLADKFRGFIARF